MKSKNHARILITIIGILYPLLIFCSLVVFKFQAHYLSIFIVIFAIAYFVINGKNYKGKKSIVLFVSPAILLVIGLVCFFWDHPVVLKLYPALADASYLIILVTSLIIPPSLISSLVKLIDKTVQGCLSHEHFENFCKKATLIWVIFFVVDTIIAIATAFMPDKIEFGNYTIQGDVIWGIYNGALTYILMAVLFVGQIIVLKIVEKKEWARQNKLEAANEDH